MSTTTYTPAQMALIEKHRGINVDHDWWDGVYEDSKEVLAAFGIDTDDISFSGFWSQGDGACFTTQTSTLEEIMRRGHATMDAKTYGDDPLQFTGVLKAAWSFWYGIAQALDAVRLTSPEGLEFCDGARVRVITRGFYSHSGTMQLDDGLSEPSIEEHDAFIEIAPTEDDLIEGLRHIADEIYDALEREHDYQTDDDQVWDTLVANEMHLDIEDEDEEEEEEEACDA